MTEMKKETYERSNLTITEFAQEDVIATSGDIFSVFFKLFKDNDAEIFQNR